MLEKREDNLPFILVRERFQKYLPNGQQYFIRQRKSNTKTDLLKAATEFEDLKAEQGSFKPEKQKRRKET